MLSDGKLLDCRFDGRSGEDAFFWMLLEPRFKTFRFVTSHEPIPGDVRSIRPLLLDSVRRADEWEKLRRLIPGTMRIKSSGRQPSLPTGERARDLVEQVWLGLTSEGLSLAELEERTGLDPYRVRRMVAYWLAREETLVRPT